MLIDIVIVNWNSGNQLEDCVYSILSHGDGLVSQTIVIDNGSYDKSPDAVENLSIVDLVRTGKNLGFGKACNVGASRGSAEFILFLNPDASLMANSLSKSVAFLQAPENASFGIVGVQLIGEDGKVQRSCARFPSPFNLFAKSLGITKLFKRTDFHRQDWDHSETSAVDHVIGAFYLIRRKLFLELGGFDERFFVYLEDLDLSLRASKTGYGSFYLADAQAFHKGGGTSDQVKAHRLFYSLRSRLQYASKHFSVPGTAIVGAATLLVEPVARGCQALLRGRVREVREMLTGYRWLLAWLAGNRTR